MRRTIMSSVLAAAFALSTVIGPAAAASDDYYVSVASKGALVAKGAAVSLQVTYKCTAVESPWGGDPVDAAYLDVTVTQAVKKGMVAKATSEMRVLCTGAPETVTVVLTADDRAFVRGAALASARGYDSQMSGAFTLTGGDQVVTIK